MESGEEWEGVKARVLLGFPPNYRPSRGEVKAAYRRKVWKCHPDLFPTNQKPLAESNFKSISQAYTLLLSPASASASASASATATWSGGGRKPSPSATNERVVKTGVQRALGRRGSHALVRVPFLFLVVGTVAFGGFNASR
ncbi:DnaJ domain containing protein [Parasponia andersonii]|uniref:DnaJ domain containing protein n=1 Tax=Parasponia andersonii TaxID=3476 RepID=A0A2P5B344_PARAD|nr:DnaJ domain containing protein [Parasponia andersonii]